MALLSVLSGEGVRHRQNHKVNVTLTVTDLGHCQDTLGKTGDNRETRDMM